MTTRRAFLVTADRSLAAEVLRLAAAAGVTVDVVPEASEAARGWHSAAAVLVGADRAEQVAALQPSRRPDVAVLGLGGVPDGVFRSALRLGAVAVIELPAAADWLLELLTDVGDDERRARPGISVAVLGASGGAGSSVFAAALAAVASEREDVLLIDLDPLGAGGRTMLGHEDLPGITWEELRASTGRLSSRALRDAVPRRGRLGVLGWPPHDTGPVPATVIREAVTAARRGHGTVVLDLPRTLDDDLLSVAASCDQALVVAHARMGPLAAAARYLHALRRSLPGCGLVLRSTRDTSRPVDLARALGLELWAEMRDQRRLDEQLALGLGPVRSRRGRLATTAAVVLDRCERRGTEDRG